MADKRKLQSDIDRNLKRVQEGRSAFQEILDKFESSNNSTQKEKFEGDLKKEIKKLQRLRDQIKTWLTASEVKDKKPLLDARKEIEQDMERFKVIEKETKTKAYSKEGLLSTDAKKDPQQREKEELDDWLKQCISLLNTQSEKYEFEIESLSNNTKKKRIDKETASLVEEKRQRLEMCCYHVEKLETTMRLLDNERLDCNKVRSIQEPIEYVIDCGDDQSLIDFKNLYDDLKLDELGDSSGITQASVSNQECELNGIVGSNVVILNKSGCDDAGSLTSTHTTTSNNTDPSLTHTGSSASSNSSSSRERTKSDEKIIIPHVSASSTSTPLKPMQSASSGKHKSSNLINQIVPPALMSQVVVGTPNKSSIKSQNVINGPTNIVASSNDVGTLKFNISNSDTSDFDNILHSQKQHERPTSRTIFTPNNTITTSISTSYTQLLVSQPIVSSDEISNAIPNLFSLSNNPINSSTLSTNKNDNTLPSINDKDSLQNLTQPSIVLSKRSELSDNNEVKNNFFELSKFTNGLTNMYTNTINSDSLNDILDKANHTPPSLLTSAMLAASQDKQISSLLAVSQHTSNLLRGNQSLGSNVNLDASSISLSINSKFQSGSLLPISPSNTQLQSSYNMALDNQLSNLQSSICSQQSKLLQNSPIHAHMHPRDAAAPFRNRNLDKPKGAVPSELLLQLQALDSGYRRLPHPCDTEKSRMIICKNPINCPSYYPRDPLPGTDNEEYYMKLDAQTLFFIFYYFEGTKAQYFAAKALKRMSWRFHTKFMMWFQRHEEPKQITDEYESGSYIYYDFRTMRQRKKEEFMFHYSFLEDKDF